MDGLECQEILLSETRKNKDFRIDSPFFTIHVLHNPNLRYSLIGDCLLSTQYGISRDMNTDNIGYQIFRMNEIYHSLCDLQTEKYVSLSSMELAEFKLNNGDVLFNRTNSYELVGRTGIYYDNGIPQVFASYLVRLVPDKTKLRPEYLAAFLNTKYGVQEIRKRSRQSINQTNVNPEEVKAIEIPLLSDNLQNQIETLYLRSHSLRLDANQLYDDTERFLDKTLGLSALKRDYSGISCKSLSESLFVSGRLDAEYYQPKYDDLFALLDRLPTKRLGEIVDIRKSIEPGSEYYGDEGVPFIRVSDVSKTGIDAPSIKIPLTTAPSIEKLYPKKNTILLSKDGSVGIAYKMEDDIDAVTSGAFLHLRVKNTKEVMPDYLTLVLNSEVVQLQAERDTNGAIIQHWKPGDIANVIIPILPSDVQIEIARKVQESFFLRQKAEKLIEMAVRAVEIAIERDEAAAVEWLNQANAFIIGEGKYESV